ncbi:MAG: hypothetical protein EAZ34_05755 [Polaromonas sp.]|nr:MAG: hypothetical protein EAZ34_05755 [Polaromonas sp.]
MTDEKPAERRSLKKTEEPETTSIGCTKRPGLLSWLHATFMFVGGFGRVLKFIDDVVDWFKNLT